MIKNLKKKKAFTLVEVIIVLAIIAIIAAIAIPNLTKVRQESKIKADNQSIETLVRTTNMLVTDESIPVDGITESTITLTYTSNVNKTIQGTGKVDTTVVSKIEDYFDDVKRPQREGHTKYVITIKADGTIEGKTVSPDQGKDQEANDSTQDTTN